MTPLQSLARRAIIATAALALLLVGCARPEPDPISEAIDAYSKEQPWKADVLHELRDEGIVKTPGDVLKVMMMLEMSCPLMVFPGMTPKSPEDMRETLAQHWQMKVTIAQTRRFQAVQQSFCAHQVTAPYIGSGFGSGS